MDLLCCYLGAPLLLVLEVLQQGLEPLLQKLPLPEVCLLRLLNLLAQLVQHKLCNVQDWEAPVLEVMR
jgi:hypothetical protein